MAKFKTRARAVDMLGRQQIAGIPTAISELFKNAHDAYAHNVEVDFFRSDDLFVLRDNGIGMTEEDFLNRWLAIGTESKVGAGTGLAPPPKPKGEEERPMLGEKGIGRLAIAAIGPQVLILTRAIRNAKQDDIVAAFINWGIFESPGVNLDEIDIPVLPYTKDELPGRDDVLTLVELFRENLDRLGKSIRPELAKRIKGELKRFDIDPPTLNNYLSSIGKPTLTNGGQGTHFLILPTREPLVADIDGDRNDDEGPAPPLVQRLIGFTNTMTSELAPVISTSFRDHKPLEPYVDLISPNRFFTPEEMETADHHFQGEFDEYGHFSGSVTIYKKNAIKHTIPWIEGKNAPTECGPFTLNLAYVQGKARESLLAQEEWVRITRKLAQIGGLYIYKDGIRVLPYGSSDYDFLDLEQRRTRKASWYYFSYRRMFGYVEISGDTNPELNEKAGREGFRENKAYRQFRAILRNFFIQMATDFFRETGEHSEAYFDTRAEIKHQDAVRRAREQQVKEERSNFTRTLNEFFSRIENGAPQKELAQLLESVTDQIQTVLKIDEPVHASIALMDVEDLARQRLEMLRGNYKVTKPRGLGLTTQLRRDWELCASEAGRLEGELFQPAQKKIEELITEAAHQQRSTVSPHQRIERALKARVTEARNIVSKESKDTKQEIEHVQSRVMEFIGSSIAEVDGVIQQASKELEALNSPKREEAYILGEYYRLEAAISEVVEKERQALEAVRSQLREVIGAPISADEIIEALEEENLALRERSEADVELAQLGMAVAVINHEFENTVRSIRSNLHRLQGWADVNKELRTLYKTIRADFDHLDAYLELFTPLEKRLFRKKVVIRGSDIAKYVRDLFEERLKREKVDMQVSNSFLRMAFNGYPSSFYPVFINLIDNSLYWLKDRIGPRTIRLDMEGGSTFTISDTGPGIPLRDREAIFERGFTRKPGGRGMGLKISRDAVAREGWELTLGDSPPGQGAAFKLRPKKQERKATKNP
jgi:signal transduction histidine kinase